jgi:hypothetical protein
LSRCEGQIGELNNLSAELSTFSEIIPQWVHDIKDSYKDDAWIAAQLQKLKEVGTVKTHLTLHQGILRYKGRICVGAAANDANYYCRKSIIQSKVAIQELM